MSEYLFGLGNGWLPKRAAKIAQKHGVELVNYCDPGCDCGYACGSDVDCPARKRHWFAGPNRGEPFDGALARAVASDLRAAGIVE